MNASDLREKSIEDLTALQTSLAKDLFSYRMKNAVGQLDDTSLLGKTRKDIARINQILAQRKAEGEKA
ncbi:MAG: 50S ribosomal protein L29 [Polyangiaceae bacterium]|nr:50S ribosomal protein L29 [Polyangiaceae bacterium]